MHRLARAASPHRVPGSRAVVIGLTFLLASLTWARAAERPEAAGAERCPAQPSPDRLDAVADDGEIRLRSGRVVRLGDVRLAGGEGRRAGIAWLRTHLGRDVTLRAGAYPDRWGRLVGGIGTVGPDPVDLAEGLVRAGLAFADSGEADRLCRPDLLGLEAAARRARLGLWSDDRYMPVRAGDSAKLGAAIGGFVLVEGRVVGVGERSSRTYLNLGPNWATDLTITVPKRTWRRMGDRGLSAAGLKGRMVRARGVLERWRGPSLEVTDPEMLEVLDGAR